MAIGIYKITSPDGKIYIGQGENVSRRMRRYFTDAIKSHPRLYENAKINGIENFKFEIIHECLANELNYWERYYQDFYNSCGSNGLNSKLTPTKDKKGVYSNDAKERMSASQKGIGLGISKKLDERKKFSESKIGNKNMLGFNHSNATKLKCKEGNLFRNKEVRCIETNKIYKSVSDCAREVGVVRRAIVQSIERQGRCKGLTYVFNNERDKVGTSETKLILNTETGIYYTSSIEASKVCGYGLSWLGKMLSGAKTNNTSLIYV